MQKVILNDCTLVYDLDSNLYLVCSHGPNGKIDVHQRTPEYIARYLLRCSVSAYNTGNIVGGDELAGFACDVVRHNELYVPDDALASYEAYERAVAALD